MATLNLTCDSIYSEAGVLPLSKRVRALIKQHRSALLLALLIPTYLHLTERGYKHQIREQQEQLEVLNKKLTFLTSYSATPKSVVLIAEDGNSLYTMLDVVTKNLQEIREHKQRKDFTK